MIFALPRNSSASVFMGALTYIGNAPNFMVKAIAEQRGIPMPTFFGYMMWSVGVLIPLFMLHTHLPVTTDPGLVELNFGQWDGLTFTQADNDSP